MEECEGNERYKDRGSIVEIKLENFITYADAVIHPGRHLNVIIGPNGTGKSTIATALALGFGGAPKLIGKPEMHVGQTVKAGCKRARIDITIRDTPTQNMVFSRTIDIQSKSSYLINNNPVTIVKFKEAVAGFNIQVDNLTQFLPQENIKGFSELTGKALLLNTERAVSDTSLETYHETLIANRALQKDLEEDITKRTARLESSEQHYAVLSEEVNQFKERKNLKIKLEALKQKRAWMNYDIKRLEYIESKKNRDAAAHRMKKCDDRLAPIDAAIRALQSEVKSLDKKLELNTAKIAEFNRQYKKCLEDIEDLHHLVKTEEQKTKAEIENEKKRDDKIRAQRQMSEKFENDMLALEEEFGAEDEIRRQLADLQQKIETQRTSSHQLSEEFNNKRTEAEQLSYQMGNLRREQKTLKDIETKRLEILSSRSRDAYQGVMWLRQNLNLFKKTVWEPMMLYIEVKENNYSIYFENVIAQRDLIAFVCEDKDDMALLLKHLRTQQKLKVNVVHSDVFRHVEMTPRVPLNEIRRFGFTNYLIDLIQAPQPILMYIVNMYHIQNIPIGRANVDDNFEGVPPAFFSFFSEKKHYSVSRSVYSGNRSTRIRDINPSGMLSLVLDSAKISTIENKIQNMEQRKAHAMQNVQVLEEKIAREKSNLDQLREDKTTLQGHYSRIQNTKLKIRDAESKLRQLEADRVDIDDIKKNRDNLIKNLIKKQIKYFDQINNCCNDVFKIAKVSESIELHIKAKNYVISEKQKESRALREKSKEAERQYKELDAEMVELKEKTRELQDVAREMTDGLTPTNTEGFKKFNAAFHKLPATLEEIEEMIVNTTARIYVFKDQSDVENKVREHEQLAIKVNKFKEDLESMNHDLRKNYEETEKIKNLWLPPLQKLVDKICHNFSGYLEKLGCAGEVKLIHGENPNDFGDYALKIMVKFRAEEPLQEFTKSRQSGGETSLTTAMYMIALQEISQVPFRCVDEINQGMDATNDRKVFEHIMDITSRGDSSQYFLLTPKLLPDLPYNDVVTVLCVFNGPEVIPHNEWTIAKYCKKLRRRKRQRQNDDL